MSVEKTEVEERAEHRVRLEYLTRQFDDLARFVKEHMQSEEDERKRIDRKLFIIAAVVVVDALVPGGGAALIKAIAL